LVVGDHLTGKSTFLDQFCNENAPEKGFLKLIDYKKFTLGCELHLKKIQVELKDKETCV